MMNRRQFVQTSAAGLMAPALLPPSKGGAPPHAPQVVRYANSKTCRLRPGEGLTLYDEGYINLQTGFFVRFIPDGLIVNIGRDCTFSLDMIRAPEAP